MKNNNKVDINEKIKDIKEFLSKNTRIIKIENLTDKDLYEKETDSRGIPLLKRIEKYPDLPEDVFIPVDYYHDGVNKKIKVPEYYWVNKKGEIKNILEDRLIQGNDCNKPKYKRVKIRKAQMMLHKIISSTFLINPDKNIYSVTNHIDHNPKNNNLSNLNFVTYSENNNIKNGTCSACVTLTSLKNRREIFLKRTNCTGNIKDYNWEPHSVYSNIWVCKEGFIRNDKKILGGISNYNGMDYVIITIKNTKVRFVHRILMEHVKGRELKRDEVVDHIDTNTLNNSFDNLRVTDYKGNRNNPITAAKFITKQLILINLYGDVEFFGSYTEIQNKYGIKGSDDKYVRKNQYVHKKYFLLNYKNYLSNYTKCLEKVIYVFDDKMNLIDCDSYANKFSKYGASQCTVLRHIKNKKPYKGYYFLQGSEAIKKLVEQGHCNILNFDPKTWKEKNKSI